jgi:hypothetical protein
VEEELDGLSRVSIVVSPRVGALDEAEVVATALRALGAGPGHRRMMSDIWQAGETLRVERREPYVTSALKVLPLHILTRR